MMNLYDFVDECREQGMSTEEALDEWERARNEREQAFFEDYYSRPDVCAGWAQQDLIDMRMRER